MSIEEISEVYNIPLKQLHLLEENGFFDKQPMVEGSRIFQGEQLSLICILLKLHKLGMSIEEMKCYVKEEQEGHESCVRCHLLKKQRSFLLEQLHEVQKNIDCLDYLLYDLTKIDMLAKQKQENKI